MTQRPLMRQSWRDLLFLHFPCDPAEVAPLLPPGLAVETFDERAWIGLVPFMMRDVRWTFAPRVPGTHTFPETNVRTYVVGPDGPGVWFFSLDAMNRLAVRAARLGFALPYFDSRMTLARDGDRVVYGGQRRDARYRIEAQLGAPLVNGPLEDFLVERYLLYAARPGRLYSGRVAHRPYALRSVVSFEADETLVRATGLPSQPFAHAAFSEGVDVEVFPLRRVEKRL